MCRLFPLFLLALTSIPSRATQFFPQEVPVTLGNTPTIIRGKVGETHSEWSKLPDGNQQLFTYTELDVKDVLKGKTLTQKILIRELGGMKNGVSLTIPGTVQLKPGEDVVLLLGDTGQDQGVETFPILNMSFGKMTVEKDEEGKEYLRGPALTGAPPSGEKRWTLSEVKNLIEHPPAHATNTQLNYRPQNSLIPGKTGLLSDNEKIVRSQSTAGSVSGTTPREPHSSESGSNMPESKLIFIGVAIGVALFLRSYLKKR